METLSEIHRQPEKCVCLKNVIIKYDRCGILSQICRSIFGTVGHLCPASWWVKVDVEKLTNDVHLPFAEKQNTLCASLPGWCVVVKIRFLHWILHKPLGIFLLATRTCRFLLARHKIHCPRSSGSPLFSSPMHATNELPKRMMKMGNYRL